MKSKILKAIIQFYRDCFRRHYYIVAGHERVYDNIKERHVASTVYECIYCDHKFTAELDSKAAAAQWELEKHGCGGKQP